MANIFLHAQDEAFDRSYIFFLLQNRVYYHVKAKNGKNKMYQSLCQQKGRVGLVLQIYCLLFMNWREESVGSSVAMGGWHVGEAVERLLLPTLNPLQTDTELNVVLEKTQNTIEYFPMFSFGLMFFIFPLFPMWDFGFSFLPLFDFYFYFYFYIQLIES